MKVFTKLDLESKDIERLANLYSFQSKQFSMTDSNLRYFSEDEARQHFLKMLDDKQHFLCVFTSDSYPVAGTLVRVIEYPEDSDMLAIFPRVCGIVSLLTLPPFADASREKIIHTLIEAIESHWQTQHAEGGIIGFPSCDSSLAPILQQHGFMAYSVIAMRTSDDFPTHPPDVLDGLKIRRIEPQDEDVTIQLIVEQMAFHERLTPFDRVIPATASGARERISKIWSGLSISDGAPIIFVAEVKGQLVGMIECAISDMRTAFSFLPPSVYGYINILAVTESQRGKGIGHHLLSAAMQALKSHDAKAFYLYYVPINPLSSRFWRNKGFHPVLTTYQKRYTHND